MLFDKKNMNLFLCNFHESYRSAKLLLSSYQRLQPIMPLTEQKFLHLDWDDLDKLDAFRVRYCDLQDGLGNKTFRSILVLEEENFISNLDIFNKMEKRGVISNYNDWKLLRFVRNIFSHDYPVTDQEKGEILNIAYSRTPDLIHIVNTTISYATKIGIPMDLFIPLSIQ